MAALPESGSARDFFLLKGSFSFIVTLDGGLDRREVSLKSIGFPIKEIVFELALYELDQFGI